MGDTKECPYCGEEILAVAIRCKHCHSDLSSKEGSESNLDTVSHKNVEYMDEATAEKFSVEKKRGGFRAVGAFIFILAAGLYAYPLLNEDTLGACSALESKSASVALQRSSGQSDSSGSIWASVLANALKRVSDGAVAEALIKARYPNLPSGLACTVAYYQLAEDPKAFDDQFASLNSADDPKDSSGMRKSTETIGKASGNPLHNFDGGRYHRAEPSSDMTITKSGNLWHIVLNGAGPDLGEQTPGDCHLEAEGQLVGDQIDAAVVPFGANESEFSSDDLKSNPGIVRVRLSPSTAKVTEATVEGFCGRHSDLTGDYVRTP